MKEIVSYVHGSFNDFMGKEHQITVCGITEKTNGSYLTICETDNDWDGEDFDVEKTLRIGYSICNPIDTYESDKGEMLACNRARSWNAIILSTSRPGMFNTATVNFLLNNFLDYIKRSPNSFIKGYKEAEEKYHEKMDLLDDIRNISEDELDVLQVLANATPEGIAYAKKIMKLTREI